MLCLDVKLEHKALLLASLPPSYDYYFRITLFMEENLSRGRSKSKKIMKTSDRRKIDYHVWLLRIEEAQEAEKDTCQDQSSNLQFKM